MFKFLHRVWVTIYWAFWAAVAFYLYTQRAAFQPALDYAEIYWNRPSAAPAQFPVFTGVVTRVYAGDGFQIRDGSAVLYNFGLAGVAAPRTNLVSTAAERVLFVGAVSNLESLVVGQRVSIDVTLAKPETYTGLGIVHSRGTNVNERVLAQGYGTLKREQIRALPVAEQYRLVRAERLAQKRRLGLWRLTQNSEPPPATASPERASTP